MRVLVLGGSGMLGHKVWETMASRFETFATVRSPLRARVGLPHRGEIAGIRAEDVASVERAFDEAAPDVVVNCVGIVKQMKAATDPVSSIEVNALFPHRVARIARRRGARMIQVSTDCVFSGSRGGYTESDEADPLDLYGRTKLLGETDYEHTLTIRTSIIGRELRGAHGLLEWFLAQSGSVRGFRRAVFSGLTTSALAATLAHVLADYPDLHGIRHVAGERITKHELLNELASAYGRDVAIDADDSVVIDRSLDDARFRTETRTSRPTWREMLEELVADPLPYEELRAA